MSNTPFKFGATQGREGGYLYVMEDTETGVEYIIFDTFKGICITPRFNPDGTLRVKEKIKK